MKFVLLFSIFALPVFALDMPNEPALHQAISSNDNERVEQLLDAKADIEELNSEGWTPLQFAVLFKKEALVKLLLKRGADPNKMGTSHSRKTPMDSLAIYSKEFLGKKGEEETPTIRIARMLVDAGADINQSRPLAEAIGQRAFGLVDWLLEHGADPSGNQILIHAAEQQVPLPLLRKLVEKGGMVNGVDFYGGPLARSTYSINHMEYLLSSGAEINASHREGYTALQNAAWMGQLDAVTFLVENGADVTQHESRAIKRATERGHTDVVMFLKQHGSLVDFHSAIALGRLDQVKLAIEGDPTLLDASMPGDYEMKPIHLAVKHGQFKMLEWLLERGAEVNATLIHQETALHLAVTRQDEAQIRLLLSHNADPNRALISGMYGAGARTPLHYAVGITGFSDARQPIKPNLKLVKLLIEHGASVEMKDESGKSIAELVQLQGSDELKRLIVSSP